MGCVTQLVAADHSAGQTLSCRHEQGLTCFHRSKENSCHCGQITEEGFPEQKAAVRRSSVLPELFQTHSLSPPYHLCVSFLLFIEQPSSISFSRIPTLLANVQVAKEHAQDSAFLAQLMDKNRMETSALALSSIT